MSYYILLRLPGYKALHPTFIHISEDIRILKIMPLETAKMRSECVPVFQYIKYQYRKIITYMKVSDELLYFASNGPGTDLYRAIPVHPPARAAATAAEAHRPKFRIAAFGRHLHRASGARAAHLNTDIL